MMHMKGKAVHYREVAYEQKAGEPRGSKAINPRVSIHVRSLCFVFYSISNLLRRAKVRDLL